MFKGFYNLASGMLTQQRVLNTVSNNIANVSTPGFKRDTMVNGTFRDMLISRTGNADTRGTVSLDADRSMIRTVYELVTDFAQGGIEETERNLDFCILGNGFFQIQTADGILYTRNGSFSINENGQLSLLNIGLVMGEGGPITLATDNINVNDFGVITDANGNLLGRISIADFNDYSALVQVDYGMFQSQGAPDIINPAGTTLRWQALEASNVSAMDEMMAMMTSQRALQSAAQVLKMYDQLMGKAVTEIGRV